MFLSSVAAHGQILFHQDQFRGGVTAIGFSTGQGKGSGIVDYYIEPGSTIKKAYLFSYKALDEPFHPIYINNQTINYTMDDTLIRLEHVNTFFATPTYILSRDISAIVTNNIGTTLEIEIPQHGAINSNAGVWCAFIYIEYENPALPLVNSVLWVNDQDYYGIENYSMQAMNPIDTNYPVGLSLMIDRACSDSIDGSIIRLNGDLSGTLGGDSLGIIGGEDASSINGCSGAKGHYYYQNNTLYGLDDDTPDNMMYQTDALADISPYLNQNETGYNLTTRHVNLMGSPANRNVNVLFINTYTSTCTEFSADVNITDTTICVGESVQLQVTGGNAYNWEPAAGLSCTDCPNPIATPQKSTWYSVTVNNTDSCSKTIPVFVKVIPNPTSLLQADLTASLCYINSGDIEVLQPVGDSLFVNGIYSGITPTIIGGLAAGDYTLQLNDTFGCIGTDSIVSINMSNNIVANFNIVEGVDENGLPVWNFNNSSIIGNNYIWYIINSAQDTVYQSSVCSGYAYDCSETYVFDSSDTYQVCLLAYATYQQCADTACQTVTVTGLLSFDAPNVFSPNNDGLNDVFAVKLDGATNIHCTILNRWGNKVHEMNTPLTGDPVKLDIWDGNYQGNPVPDGVYFYVIKLTNLQNEVVEFTGFIKVKKY